MLKNDRLIRALLRQPVDRTPIWIMRQAGRYLPEYREVRKQAGDFMTLCQTPELACEVTLQPLRRFDLDAAILFSDILTIPDAMGLGLYFSEGEGPKFKHPIDSVKSIQSLVPCNPLDSLGYVMDAVSLIKRELAGRVPLIGFSGSPWTLATYMIEGGSSKTFSRVKKLIYDQPESAHHLLSVLAESVTQYLNAQVDAGADALMIFDTWGGVLSTPSYHAFSLAYMAQIVKRLKRERDGQTIPVTLFTKSGGLWLESLAETGCDALGLDWTLELANARARVGNQVALQGNMDPACLYAKPDKIKPEVARCLASFGAGEGHVFNLGHGITPDVVPSSVSVLVEAVHELSEPYHANRP